MFESVIATALSEGSTLTLGLLLPIIGIGVAGLIAWVRTDERAKQNSELIKDIRSKLIPELKKELEDEIRDEITSLLSKVEEIRLQTIPEMRRQHSEDLRSLRVQLSQIVRWIDRADVHGRSGRPT